MIISLQMMIEDKQYYLGLVSNGFDNISIISADDSELQIVNHTLDVQLKTLTVEFKVKCKFYHLVFIGELDSDVEIFCVEKHDVLLTHTMFVYPESTLDEAAMWG